MEYNFANTTMTHLYNDLINKYVLTMTHRHSPKYWSL